MEIKETVKSKTSLQNEETTLTARESLNNSKERDRD